jgi:hypothetical protein
MSNKVKVKLAGTTFVFKRVPGVVAGQCIGCVLQDMEDCGVLLVERRGCCIKGDSILKLKVIR